MSNTFKIKRGSTAPSNGDLEEGELGFNKSSKLLYIGGSDGIDWQPYSPYIGNGNSWVLYQ